LAGVQAGGAQVQVAKINAVGQALAETLHHQVVADIGLLEVED